MSDMMLDREVPEEAPEEVIPEAPPEPQIDRDKLASVLWNLVRDFEQEDEEAHREFFNQAVRSEFYWNNEQHVYKQATGLDSFEWKVDDDESTEYTANIYRPNGESIIAAMSVQVPQVNFFPDDAENPDDIVTANAYQRIATLVQKHNKAQSLLVRILYILYNQSFVAVYNYNRKSFKFGSYDKENYQDSEQIKETTICPYCGAPVEAGEDPASPPTSCQVCGNSFEAPEVIQEAETVPMLVGITQEPKTRECLHAFGPLHVKVAPYVQEQEDSPYLILEFERHPSYAASEFPEFKDKLTKGGLGSQTEYERDYRAELYKGDADNLDTWKCAWVRNWAYETLEDEDEVYAYLKKLYPDGFKAIFVNGILVEIENENLDEHWTINRNPLTTFINGEPIGKSCLPVQDATNELLNLSMDTIKHGIPQTFADAQIIDFNQYQNSEVKPGMIYPTRQLPTGQSLANYIHTTRTATLSQEVDEVWDKLQQLSQLTTGAFPSIYGGVVQGSRTASEYAQSRAQALQRLSITWSMVKQLWADVMSKACVSYARNLDYDEKEVQKNGNGYINVWIRRAELSGKIGQVEPEVDEQLPTSWAQQREVLMRLIELNSPMINEVLMDPENAYTVKNGLGFKEIKIPGYDDRLKQLEEIQELTQGVPVQVDPILDDHETESAVCRSFLIGEVGRDLRNTNPQAYQMVYDHYLEHMQILAERAAQLQAEQAQMQQQNQKPAEKNNERF